MRVGLGLCPFLLFHRGGCFSLLPPAGCRWWDHRLPPSISICLTFCHHFSLFRASIRGCLLDWSTKKTEPVEEVQRGKDLLISFLFHHLLPSGSSFFFLPVGSWNRFRCLAAAQLWCPPRMLQHARSCWYAFNIHAPFLHRVWLNTEPFRTLLSVTVHDWVLLLVYSVRSFLYQQNLYF